MRHNALEIVPLSRPIVASVTIPGSKSITNRAMVLAALSGATTTLARALWSEDTQMMVECLARLGYIAKVESDASDSSNRRITITGKGAHVPRGGTRESPLELFVGNAGTTTRLLCAMLCLGSGYYRLTGTPRMHQRPQRALFEALRSLGYSIESNGECLPVTIEGGGAREGNLVVSVAESSQFASALLLSSSRSAWNVAISDGKDDELAYVEMTRKLMKAFPSAGGDFDIEIDASSGSYLVGARYLLEQNPQTTHSRITIPHWPQSSWQIDARFPGALPLKNTISRKRDLGDSILTAIVLAPFADVPVLFTDLGHLQGQESNRLTDPARELSKCGARVEVDSDSVTVYPSLLHGAEIETYNDHRIAMCFAMLGLVGPHMRIRNPACVAKTFPNFFAKFAAKPPHGLGVTILDAESGAPLSAPDLVYE